MKAGAKDVSFAFLYVQKIIIVQDKLNSKGFHPVGISDMEKCIGCAFCAMMCPDCVIEVEK